MSRNSDTVRTEALIAENEKLRTYAERLAELRAQFPEIVRDAVGEIKDGDGMPVSVCKAGCQPIWTGWHEECPQCGAKTRQTETANVEGGPE